MRRLAAIRDIWSGGGDYAYGRMVLTAYAAARLPVDADLGDDTGALIASMLTAGLDGDALPLAPTVYAGSPSFALLCLAVPR